MLRAVTSLVAPPLCGLCGEACDHRNAVCRRCERRVTALRAISTTLPSGIEMISAGPYEGVARELVGRMKFGGRLSLAEVAAERMIRAWGAARSGLLVPVPPAPARQRIRGFDPAYVLARLVARGTAGARVRACLAREDGPRQVGRPRTERLSDPPRVRLLSSDLASEDVWLVDDVVTTGATLSACANALRNAGAARIRALAFARADSLGGNALAA